MVWLAIVIALPISFLSDWIVVFLYGEAYRQAGSVLMINIWAGVFVFFASAWSMHMIANNNQKQFIKFDLLSTFFNIVLNLILIPRLGITGAAVATAFSIPITFVLFFFFYKDQKSTIICFIKALFLLSLFEKRSYK
jgi:O-antigen/teichoic acid export membrane protein